MLIAILKSKKTYIMDNQMFIYKLNMQSKTILFISYCIIKYHMMYFTLSSSYMSDLEVKY